MILIIDDDEDQGELTRQRLEAAGLKAKLQTSPFGNLASMQRGDYPLVILDVNMPALPGTRIMELLIRSGSKQRSKVMFYSNLDETELSCVAERCGADGWLSKSAGRSAFLQSVHALLRSTTSAS